MIIMPERKRTSVFWTGLLILGLSSGYLCIFLFNMVTSSLNYHFSILKELWSFALPFLTGTVAFMLISVFMMHSGRKQEMEKKHTGRYWIGLVIFGMASWWLLVMLWLGLVWLGAFDFDYWLGLAPFIAGAMGLAAIGSYGMKTGIKRINSEATATLIS